MTQTERLLARTNGKVTTAQVKTAGGKLVETRGSYSFWEMPDNSRIAIYIPLNGVRVL